MASEQPNNPLHGLTLEKILVSLQEFYGWEGLGERIRIRCFNYEPSIKSSLKFLRKTPWARKELEELFLYTLAKYGEEDEAEEAEAVGEALSAEDRRETEQSTMDEAKE
jgi:uncharacterized protein (DUF2132 family)